MARTPRQLAGLCVAIAFAISGGGGLFLSQALGQDELGPQLDGKKLFDKETFGGNGRTCLTCHSERTGTLSVLDVQRIIEQGDPNNTFLTFDALDDDGGTTRVQTHATIRVTIPLPPWVSLADDPGATHVTVFRGIPSTRNTPALDPVLHHDGRALPRYRIKHVKPSTAITRTPSNRRRRSSTPSQNSSRPAHGSFPRMRSGRSPLAGHRLNCPREGRRPNSEDARSWSTRPSALLQRRASAPCVIAVRC